MEADLVYAKYPGEGMTLYPVEGPTFGADLDIVVSDSFGVGLRFGADYIEKGGEGYGRDADGESRRTGTLATSYLQFSALLRARAVRTPDRSPSLVLLAGPWVGTQLSCEKEGHLAANCEVIDFGIALGVGVELALPRTSRAGVALEWMFYGGMRGHSQYRETTRFSGVQVGFVYRIG